MKKPIEKTTLAKLKKLDAIAKGLQSGEDYPITRLTALKSLCAEQKAAAKFALHLAKLAEAEAATHARPQPLKIAAWREHKELIARSVERLESYIKKPTKSRKMGLYDVLAEVQGVNSEYKPFR
jgi:hypothetical protein